MKTEHREYIVHTEWSLPLIVVLKHRDTWFYMKALERSQNTVNALYKTYRAGLS